MEAIKKAQVFKVHNIFTERTISIWLVIIFPMYSIQIQIFLVTFKYHVYEKWTNSH